MRAPRTAPPDGLFGHRMLATFASVLVAAGLTAGLIAERDQDATASAAAQSPSSTLEAANLAAAGGSGALQDPTPSVAPTTDSAPPTRIRIPSIHVNASLQSLATDAKGVLQPPDSWTAAGWYAKGVVPGNDGPAVIAGHLDTTLRSAVFVSLKFLRPGDPIYIDRSDGTSVRFEVTRSAVVKKAFFPTSAVYGPTPDPQLRLITCSEPFDDAQGVYADNLVVFAAADPA